MTREVWVVTGHARTYLLGSGVDLRFDRRGQDDDEDDDNDDDDDDNDGLAEAQALLGDRLCIERGNRMQSCTSRLDMIAIDAPCS